MLSYQFYLGGRKEWLRLNVHFNITLLPQARVDIDQSRAVTPVRWFSTSPRPPCSPNSPMLRRIIKTSWSVSPTLQDERRKPARPSLLFLGMPVGITLTLSNYITSLHINFICQLYIIKHSISRQIPILTLPSFWIRFCFLYSRRLIVRLSQLTTSSSPDVFLKP